MIITLKGEQRNGAWSGWLWTQPLSQHDGIAGERLVCKQTRLEDSTQQIACA